MTYEESIRADSIDTIDALPKPQLPMLCFVSAQGIAEHAVTQGFTALDAGRHEHALGAVYAAANQLMPPEHSETPNAWTRRGARDGIIAAWRGTGMVPPGLNISDGELYCAAFSLTTCATMRCIAAAKKERGLDG